MARAAASEPTTDDRAVSPHAPKRPRGRPPRTHDATHWRQLYKAKDMECRALRRKLEAATGQAHRPLTDAEVERASVATWPTLKRKLLGLIMATIERAQQSGRITLKEAIEASRAVNELLGERRGPGRPAGGKGSPEGTRAAAAMAGWPEDGDDGDGEGAPAPVDEDEG